jgi:DNA-3-methyladenine glycosylase II
VDTSQELLTQASTELAERSPEIARLFESVGPCVLPAPTENNFTALGEAIVYQQLTGKAAGTIWNRLLVRLEGDFSPQTVIAAPEEKLRAAGLSRNKAASIRDLAAKAIERSVPFDDLDELSDDDIVTRLSAVRGIGVWTAEMFLIFQLRRFDVWPIGDLGVRKGYARMFGMDPLPLPKELAPLGDPFRPFRTVAAWYCWRAVETVTPGSGR